mgnify:CR=1 FL=1
MVPKRPRSSPGNVKVKSCSLCSESVTFRANQCSRLGLSTIAKTQKSDIVLTLQRERHFESKTTLSLQSERDREMRLSSTFVEIVLTLQRERHFEGQKKPVLARNGKRAED